VPRIPKIKSAPQVSDIGSKEHALAMARVLGGKSKREDTSRFLAIVRKYFREEDEAKEGFIEWYQNLPGEEPDDEDEPTPKKKKKHRKEEE
jgi:hypothetical protein